MLTMMFVFDFFYYWLHRFQHKLPVLWQEHLLHHSAEHLSVVVTRTTVPSLSSGSLRRDILTTPSVRYL